MLLADDERVGLESTYVAVARIPDLDTAFDPDSSFYAHLAAQGIAFGDADERTEDQCSPPRARPCSSAPRRPSRCCSSTVSPANTEAARWNGCARSTGATGSSFTAHLSG
ncbi:hypothetical protein STENM327S_07953 [Streptomyces tendae]